MKTMFERIGGALVCTLAGCVMYSCVKEDADVTDISVAEADSYEVNISVLSSGAETRMTDTGNESAVNSLQIFVFRTDGTLEVYGSAEGSELSLECTSGEREFVAIANAGDLSGIKTKAELESESSALSENRAGNLVMSGSAVRTVGQSGDGAAVQVPITVRRLVAKVSVTGISNRMDSPAYQSIEVKAVYLSNVAGDSGYLSPGTPQVWLNKLGTQEDEKALLHSGSLSFRLDKEAFRNISSHFYCYPNSTDSDAAGGEWSPRHTRIVVETVISGKTFYYPVTLPVIEPNHTYEITDIRISRLGSTSPDIPVEVGAAQLLVTIKSWEKGTSTQIII